MSNSALIDDVNSIETNSSTHIINQTNPTSAWREFRLKASRKQLFFVFGIV